MTLYPAFSIGSFVTTSTSACSSPFPFACAPAAALLDGGSGLISCHSTESTRNRIGSPLSIYSRLATTVLRSSEGVRMRSSSSEYQNQPFCDGSLSDHGHGQHGQTSGMSVIPLSGVQELVDRIRLPNWRGTVQGATVRTVCMIQRRVWV
jgi:hypothetical protein